MLSNALRTILAKPRSQTPRALVDASDDFDSHAIWAPQPDYVSLVPPDSSCDASGASTMLLPPDLSIGSLRSALTPGDESFESMCVTGAPAGDWPSTATSVSSSPRSAVPTLGHSAHSECYFSDTAEAETVQIGASELRETMILEAEATKQCKPRSFQHAAVEAGMAWILVTEGPQAGLTALANVSKGTVSIGRHPSNTLVIPDAEISAKHGVLELIYEDGAAAAVYRDLRSTNGTWHTGRRVSSVACPAVPAHTLLQLGTRTVIRLVVSADLPRCESTLRLPALAVVASQASAVSAPAATRPQKPSARCTAAQLDPPFGTGPIASCVVRSGFNQSRARHKAAMAGSFSNGSDPTAAPAGSMEDEFVMVCPVPGYGAIGLLCVFDGHCGKEAAASAKRVACECLVHVLQQRGYDGTSLGPSSMSTVLSALFVALDAALAAQGHEYVGCTATVVLGWKDAGGNVYIQAANVGDSAAFLIRADTEPMALTIDHRLAAPSERERLTALGILLQVRWMGRACAMHRPVACLYASMYGTL